MVRKQSWWDSARIFRMRGVHRASQANAQGDLHEYSMASIRKAGMTDLISNTECSRSFYTVEYISKNMFN
jgi:hypothetical protein